MFSKPCLFLGCATAWLLVGCDKDDVHEPAAATNAVPGPGYSMTIDSPVGAYFLIDGQEVIINDSNWSQSFAALPDPGTGYPFADVGFTLDSGAIWQSAIGRTSLTDPLPLQELLDLLAVGPRSYVAYPADTGSGVCLLHWEPPYEPWGTACGSSDQDGSEFVIEESAFVDDVVDTIKVLARFNCELYQCNGSGRRTIQYGRLRFDMPCPS